MKYFKTIFIAAIVVIFCVLYVQNEEVFTNQFRLSFDLSVYKIGPYLVYNVALIGAAFLLGVIFSVIYGVFHSGSKGSEISKKNQKIKELENEVSDLKDQLKSKSQESVSETTNLFSPPSSDQENR